MNNKSTKIKLPSFPSRKWDIEDLRKSARALLDFERKIQAEEDLKQCKHLHQTS